MRSLVLKLAYLLIGIATLSCVYHIEGNDDMNPLRHGSLLDKTKASNNLLGDSEEFQPGIATAGSKIFTQDFLWGAKNISASDGSNTDMVTITMDSFPEDANGEAFQAFWYLLLQYGTGNALNGSGIESTTATSTTKDENLIDLGTGSSICVPASNLTMKIRLVALHNDVAGFTGAGPAAFKRRISMSLAYGNKTNSRQATMTQPYGVQIAAGFPLGLNPLPNNGVSLFKRPKYANAVQFTWTEMPTVGPLLVIFNTENNFPFAQYNLAANVTPAPIIPWPEPAVYAQVRNTSGVNITALTAQNYLVL